MSAGMQKLRNTILAAVGALGLMCGAAQAAGHPPDGLVVFVNMSSASVSISVDGASVCTIAPGTRCTTVLTGDTSVAHTVAAQSGTNTWTDAIKISECHANYLGTKTFTFYNDEVPFSCEKQEAAAAPSAPPPAALAKPASSPAKATAQSDIKACKTYSPDTKARLAACTRIIESKNPGFADLVAAYVTRCDVRYVAQEPVANAIADCTRAVTLDPKNFEAIYTRGIVYSNTGSPDAAIADLTKAIALETSGRRAYASRAMVYLDKKDLQKAIADFTAARDDEVSFRRSLCWARMSLNVELDTALSDCESVVSLQPNGTFSYHMRGLVRLRKGDLKEARADFDKAVALSATNAASLYGRAIVNAREGKTMASADDLQAAKKIAPEIAKSYAKLGFLLTVQAETAPFCPAMTALIKAAGERAASKAKADVVMPGATTCMAIDRGYWCTWETGPAQAPAKQATLATAAAACLAGYTRKDSNGVTGPAAEFASGKTRVTVGTMYELKTKSIVAAGVAVSIAKPEASSASTAKPSAPKPRAISEQRLRMLKDLCRKQFVSPQECKEAGIVK